jgi:hypothetical protein
MSVKIYRVTVIFRSRGLQASLDLDSQTIPQYRDSTLALFRHENIENLLAIPMERAIDITVPKKNTEMEVSVDEFPRQRISDKRHAWSNASLRETRIP